MSGKLRFSEKKPGLVPTTGIYCVVALILLLTIGLVIIDSLSQISVLATGTRDELLPAILDKQRTAVNLEKMGRFADIVYRSDDPRIRRQYKLAAHILSQDTVFEGDPILNQKVVDAYRDIEMIAELREREDEICSGCDAIIFSFMPGTDNADAMLKLSEGKQLLNFMLMADKAENLEALGSIRENFKTITGALTNTPSDIQNALFQADALFDNRADVLVAKRATDRLWNRVNTSLEETSANLSAKAAVTADDRFTFIANEAGRAQRNGLFAAGGLMLALLILLYFAQRDIVVPILRYVEGLNEIARGKRQIDIPEARLKELDAIRRAVQRSEELMTQIGAKTEEMQEANEALEKEIEIRKKAQKDLALQKERAESADRAKSDFLAGMSHEIRTPMNAMLGMSDLLLETDPTATQKNYIESLKSSGDMLMGIINDILDLSKIEAGQIELESTTIDRDEFLARTRRIVAERANQKGLDFVIDIEEDVPTHFKGDPTRLRQVLVNLIDNGVKFTEEGEVRLSIHRADPDVPGLLTFAVIDTGIGISEDAQEQIFHQFTQADTSTTRRYGGTGLGLAISLRLVELMGGTIKLESAIAQGSAFHFTVKFDLAEEPQFVDKPVTAETITSENTLANTEYRVLFAEDSDSNQALFGLYFRETACKLDFACDGLEAVESFEKQDYDLVLMDIQMPKMDGYEATRKIREIESERGTPPIPIVAVTANAFKEDQKRSQEAGCTDYLAKPVSKANLLACVARYVGASHPAG